MSKVKTDCLVLCWSLDSNSGSLPFSPCCFLLDSNLSKTCSVFQELQRRKAYSVLDSFPYFFTTSGSPQCDDRPAGARGPAGVGMNHTGREGPGVAGLLQRMPGGSQEEGKGFICPGIASLGKILAKWVGKDSKRSRPRGWFGHQHTDWEKGPGLTSDRG